MKKQILLASFFCSLLFSLSTLAVTSASATALKAESPKLYLASDDGQDDNNDQAVVNGEDQDNASADHSSDSDDNSADNNEDENGADED